MCEMDSYDENLEAYADVAKRERLRIVDKGTGFVPVDRRGYVQRFGFQDGPEGLVRVIWKSGRWERWVPPE